MSEILKQKSSSQVKKDKACFFNQNIHKQNDVRGNNHLHRRTDGTVQLPEDPQDTAVVLPESCLLQFLLEPAVQPATDCLRQQQQDPLQMTWECWGAYAKKIKKTTNNPGAFPET